MKCIFIALSIPLFAGVCKSQQEPPPNLIFVLADDMGFNDIGYHNRRILTPKMDELARMGITLEQNYMQPSCTPSRAALLTGMYPYHIGRQGDVIKARHPTGLTLDRELLSEKLTELGYDSHVVGKWHLGFCDEKYLPLNRGFASHYGYWLGEEGYYTKVHYYLPVLGATKIHLLLKTVVGY